MAQGGSYCEVTPEWVAFTTKSTRVTVEAAADAMRGPIQEVARIAAQIAPWKDETGDTRNSFIGWTSEDDEPSTYDRPPQVTREYEVRAYVGRQVTDHGQYLAMMEQGLIGGWGNPPPVQSWDPAANENKTAEQLAMERSVDWLIDQVRARFFEEFGRKIGSFRGDI